MFNLFSAETKSLVKTAISLSYYMRGALQYHDAYDLSPVERDMINEFVNDRLDTEMKKPPSQVY